MNPSTRWDKLIQILGRWEYLIGILGILLTIGIAVAVILFWEEVRALEHYGYIGVFVISAFGGATVLAPVPMTPVVFALGGVLNPAFVGAAAGLGETIGGLAIYMTGYGGGTALIDTNHGRIQAAYSRVLVWMRRRGGWTLFLLSAVVNPFFYPAGLAAGALRFGVKRFFFICWGGKTIKGMTVAFAGYLGLRALFGALGIPV